MCRFATKQTLKQLDKVPSGGMYTPDQCYHLFLKSTKYVALTLEMAVICYTNTTLKEFSHILGEVPDLDLKGMAAGNMLNKNLRTITITIINTSEINQSLLNISKNFDICMNNLSLRPWPQSQVHR